MFTKMRSEYYCGICLCPDCCRFISFDWLKGATPPNVFICSTIHNEMLHLTTWYGWPKKPWTSYLYHTITIEVSYDAVEFGVRRIQIHDLLCTITPKTLRILEIGYATLEICVRHTWCSKIRVRRSRSTSTTHPEAMIRIWYYLFALHSP